MNNLPEISVIVPVYKVEKYLPQCIDSILAQTFTDFELLLVDDGSPDRCGEICEEYAGKDTRIRVFHQANAGLSCARNTGLMNACGRYKTVEIFSELPEPSFNYCKETPYWQADNFVFWAPCPYFVAFGIIYQLED